MTSVIQKCVLKGTIASVVQIRNVFYAQVEISGPSLIPTIWGEYLDGIWFNIKPMFSIYLQYNSFEVYDLVDGEWIIDGEYEYATGGTDDTGDLMPNSVAVVLVGKVLGYRGFGRKFFSGLSESYTSGNDLATTLLENMVLAAAAYVAPLDGLNGVLGPGIVDKQMAFHSFTTGLVSSLLGSMRRRKPGIGI